MAPKAQATGGKAPSKAEQEQDILRIQDVYTNDSPKEGEITALGDKDKTMAKLYEYRGSSWKFMKRTTREEADELARKANEEDSDDEEEAPEAPAEEEEAPKKKAVEKKKEESEDSEEKAEESESSEEEESEAEKAVTKKKVTKAKAPEKKAEKAEKASPEKKKRQTKKAVLERILGQMHTLASLLEDENIPDAKKLVAEVKKELAKKEKGTREPTPYNKWMKMEMGRLKEEEGVKSSKERIAIASSTYREKKEQGFEVNDEGVLVKV